MIWNNEGNVELFNKYAGKIYDHELAMMLGCAARTIQERRKQYGIKKFSVTNYSEAAVNYIFEHYKRKGDLELTEILKPIYPDDNISARGIRALLKKNKLSRTRKEQKFIRNQPFIKSKKSAALKKAHLKRSPHIGDIVFRLYSNKRQWCIKIGSRHYAAYAKYLWLQHFGSIPGGMRADWIDSNAPLTIDNIKLIKYIKTRLPIGAITKWKHLNRVRELIKVAEGEYQLLLPYLWRQNGGDIPPGMWIEKIDESKPTTIDNLRITHQTIFQEGAKNLDDWYIRGLLSRNATPEVKEALKNNPTLIQEKRAVVEALRVIKNFENGT